MIPAMAFSLWAKGWGLRPPVWFPAALHQRHNTVWRMQQHRLLVERHVAVSDVIARDLVEGGIRGTPSAAFTVAWTFAVCEPGSGAAAARPRVAGDVPRERSF